MSRIGLAFSSFFRLLFGKKLAPEAVAYLPEEAVATLALPPGKAETAGPDKPAGRPAADKPADRPAADKPADRPAADKDAARPRSAAAEGERARAQRDGALALLALLQREGRLVDFLRESLDGHGDADIGAAARDVHRGCKKVLDQCFTFEAVMPGEEDAKVSVPRGFDPVEVRLIGEARGEPPFGGTLRHHGWRATRAQLPALTDGVDRTVVAPAEVEVS
ncbi:MAG: DUF2760 domain-containing protein [Myxococcales bacterium]|nr:DUF2760 domain-containing protein [Myxococcales bacterium]